MSIEDWRSEINAIDDELLRLLNIRARLAIKVGQSKKVAGFSILDPVREREVIDRACRGNQGPLDEGAIIELFSCIIHESRRVETQAMEQDEHLGQ